MYTGFVSKEVVHHRKYNRSANTLTIWIEMSDTKGAMHRSSDKVLDVASLNQSVHMETMLIAAYDGLIREVTDLINTFDAMGV